MLKEKPAAPHFDEVASLVEKMGYKALDFGVHHQRGSVRAELILFNEEGISIGDCTKVTEVLLPRLEILLDNQDVRLEVSSPGLSRQIKTFYELDCLIGQGIKIYLANSNDWISGILGKTKDNYTLKQGDNIMTIEARDIMKVKLDDTIEVGK